MKRLLLLIAVLLLAGCGTTGGTPPTIIADHGGARLLAAVGSAGAPTVGEVMTATTGTWTNSPTSFAFQWQRCATSCGNIAGATASSYTVQAADALDTLRVVVTASNSSGSASQTSAPTGTVTGQAFTAPCNNTTALTDYLNGPHLCGWPDATNTGYANAPGYPGGLTIASSGSLTCPTAIQSNHTYSFCKYTSPMGLPANLSNVTFYADDFYVTNPNNANLAGGAGDNNITFNYDTFQPATVYPGPPDPSCYAATTCEKVTCPNSYQYGIYNEGGAMKGFTVEHSWFWGFGNAIDTSGSTQAAPQIFEYNFFSDAVTDSSCGYHTDGIGMLNTAAQSYATVDHNAFSFVGNTNEIAWQNGTYDHITNTNNLLDGDNAMYAGARCTTSCTPATNIVTTGNTFDAFLPHGAGNYPTDLAGGYATAASSTWNHNYWMVPPGSSPTSAAGTSPNAAGTHNGEFIIPNDHSNGFPNDCGWVSASDYPNLTTDC